jgi:hypothetical protein
MIYDMYQTAGAKQEQLRKWVSSQIRELEVAIFDEIPPASESTIRAHGDKYDTRIVHGNGFMLGVRQTMFERGLQMTIVVDESNERGGFVPLPELAAASDLGGLAKLASAMTMYLAKLLESKQKGAKKVENLIVEDCQIEWDRKRGVLYVHNKATGSTAVRISGLPPTSAEVELDFESLIDVKTTEELSSVPQWSIKR